MATYVVFLRAINLGARRKFGKDDLARVTGEAGFGDVVTHINTGNVRVTTRLRSRARVEEVLEQAYLADRGFEVPTIAFTPDELRAVLSDAEQVAAELGDYDGPQSVSLLKREPDDADLVALLEARGQDGERAIVRGRAVHVITPHGYGVARLSNTDVERRLGVATNRNLSVIRALVQKWC